MWCTRRLRELRARRRESVCVWPLYSRIDVEGMLGILETARLRGKETSLTPCDGMKEWF